MHPSQQTLLRQANDLSAKLAATVLWKYVCPDSGKTFYLQEKVVTIRSPFTGKTFTTKPERESLGEVGKALREESKTAASIPDQHQLKILKDTVRNPMKGFLGGPSAEEAEETLREKFHFTDKQIRDLKT